jgi:dienelactone hydrolase
MNAHGIVGRRLVGLAVVVGLAGCASGGGQTPSPLPPTDAPSPAVATPTPVVAAMSPARSTPLTTPPTVKVTTDLPYESADPAKTPDAIDVYAPTGAGPWPVVVMFHGAPGGDPATDRADLSANARRVAELGFVVFNASWGHQPADMSWYDGGLAVQSQGACAVEFARALAAAYGGDPATMIVFGHSGGANTAAMVVFARPTPTAGCLGGATLGEISALVTWEGNWLLAPTYPDWNAILAEDPRVMDANTPWKHLAEHKDLRVVVLVSEDPGPQFVFDVGDPWVASSWLAARDPSGNLRRQLEANGALADGKVGQSDADRLLYAVLKAQGNPVTLGVMPGSSHTWLSDEGWKVFLAAFPKAAQGD